MRYQFTLEEFNPDGMNEVEIHEWLKFIGKTADRYTVVYLDCPTKSGCFEAVGMSANPFHPQGLGQHTEAMPGRRHLGKLVKFESLPVDCQKLVRADLQSDRDCERLGL